MIYRTSFHGLITYHNQFITGETTVSPPPFVVSDEKLGHVGLWFAEKDPRYGVWQELTNVHQIIVHWYHVLSYYIINSMVFICLVDIVWALWSLMSSIMEPRCASDRPPTAMAWAGAFPRLRPPWQAPGRGCPHIAEPPQLLMASHPHMNHFRRDPIIWIQ